MDNYILALLHCKGVGTTKLYNYIKKNHFELEKIKNNIKDIIIENDYNMFDKYLIDAQNEINKNKNYGISIIPPIKKTLACGDTGIGAMANIDEIVKSIRIVK